MSQQVSVFPPPQLQPPQPPPKLQPPQPQPQPQLAVYGNKPQPQAPPGVTDPLLYKNNLHRYVAKLGLPAPIYVTQNEGVAHAPLFRVTVYVDNTHYTSQKLFTNKKYAEQETARIALDALLNKVNDEGSSLINENIIYCKGVLNEYAAKMHLDLPTYQTTKQQQQGLVTFTSSLVFGGLTFTGQVARNKRDAELLAARSAILSILGTPGPDSTIMSKIIKSHYKPYAALNLGNISTAPNVTPIIPVSNDTELKYNSGSPLNKGKEVMTTDNMNDVATGAVIGNPSNHVATVQVQYQPWLELKKPILDTPTAPTPPIPSIHEQDVVAKPDSSNKRRKNKKKKPQPVAQPVVPSEGAIPGSLLNKGKELEVMVASETENQLGETAFIQILNDPLHQAKKPKIDAPTSAAITPTVFELPAQLQPAGAGPSSLKKRRKKKKKVPQPAIAEFPQPIMPANKVPCSVPQ